MSEHGSIESALSVEQYSRSVSCARRCWRPGRSSTCASRNVKSVARSNWVSRSADMWSSFAPAWPRTCAAAGSRGRRGALRLARRHRRAQRAAAAQAAPWRQQHRRGRQRQGWRRQVDRGGQSGAGLGRRWRAGRHSRCRYLRPEPADHAGSAGPAPDGTGRQAPRAAGGARRQGHVDRISRRCRPRPSCGAARWSRRP